MNHPQPGTTRRHFLQVGALGVGLGGLGLNLAGYLRLAHAGKTSAAKAKSAIVIHLGGGPTHLDSFDPKPEGGTEIRGEFQAIDTNVPGIRISEHLPLLAKCADKYTILRGVSHSVGAHEMATEYLSTGNRPIPSLIFPGYGAVVSRELKGAADLPHFVAIPDTAQKAGYLGVRYAPLKTAGIPQAGQPFSVRGVSLTEGLTVEQFEKRQRLLTKLDTAFAEAKEDSKLLDGLDRFAQQAHDMISSPRALQAFDVSQERTETADLFGTQKFGMSCLLASRLVEAGVNFVTVNFGGWDTHSNNFKQARESLLPSLDRGLSALFMNLADKGLLASTAILVTGEFGRTPKINDKAGRDHWPRAMFALMAGGGMKPGQVLGESDENGAGPAGDLISPDQVAASFYHSLGIDYRQEYHTTTGRPVMIVREGSLVPGLFA